MRFLNATTASIKARLNRSTTSKDSHLSMSLCKTVHPYQHTLSGKGYLFQTSWRHCPWSRRIGWIQEASIERIHTNWWQHWERSVDIPWLECETLNRVSKLDQKIKRSTHKRMQAQERSIGKVWAYSPWQEFYEKVVRASSARTNNQGYPGLWRSRAYPQSQDPVNQKLDGNDVQTHL